MERGLRGGSDLPPELPISLMARGHQAPMPRIALLPFAITMLAASSASAAPVRAGEFWSLDAGRYTLEFKDCAGGLCARLAGTSDPEARPICGELILHSLKPKHGRLVGRFVDYEEGRDHAVALIGARNGATLIFLDGPTELETQLVRAAGTPSNVARLCSLGKKK